MPQTAEILSCVSQRLIAKEFCKRDSVEESPLFVGAEGDRLRLQTSSANSCFASFSDFSLVFNVLQRFVEWHSADQPMKLVLQTILQFLHVKSTLLPGNSFKLKEKVYSIVGSSVSAVVSLLLSALLLSASCWKLKSSSMAY